MKTGVRRLPPYATALLVAAAFVVSLSLIVIAARLVLGSRGTLVPLLLEYLIPALICALLVRALSRRVSSGTRTARILAAIFAAVGVLAGWQALRVAADIVLPFDERQETVVSTRYHFGTRSLGEWHLLSDTGHDYAFPPIVKPHLQPGRYELKLSRLNHLVMETRRIN